MRGPADCTFQNFWYMHSEMASGNKPPGLTMPGLVTPATAVTRTGTDEMPQMLAKNVRTGPWFCPSLLARLTCTAGASVAAGVMGKPCNPAVVWCVSQ